MALLARGLAEAGLQRRRAEGQRGAKAIAVMEILIRRPALAPHREGCWQGRRELPQTAGRSPSLIDGTEHEEHNGRDLTKRRAVHCW